MRRLKNQQILPTRTYRIAAKPLRQFMVDGQIWYPIYDVIPLIETSRNATQISKSMPSHYTMKLQTTKRPATNMINDIGLRYLIDRAPDINKRGTRSYALAQWAQTHLRIPDSETSRVLAEKIAALQGEIRVQRDKLETNAARLESMIQRYERIKPSAE